MVYINPKQVAIDAKEDIGALYFIKKLRIFLNNLYKRL